MSTIDTLQPGLPVPLFTFCGKLIESGWFGVASNGKTKRNSTVSRDQLRKVGEKVTEETTAGGQTTLSAI